LTVGIIVESNGEIDISGIVGVPDFFVQGLFELVDEPNLRLYGIPQIDTAPCQCRRAGAT
jgi:hypothetical protein